MENLNEFSTKLLKNVCAAMGMPSTGNKAQLVARLQVVSPDELEETISSLGQQNIQKIDVQQNIQNNGENDENQHQQNECQIDVQNIIQQDNLPFNSEGNANLDICASDSNDQQRGAGVCLCTNETDNQQKTADANIDGNIEETVLETQTHARELQLLRRENELLKRERDLMQRENELLKLTSNSNIEQNSGSTVSPKLIGSFIPDYDGNSDGNFWITQLRDVQQTYGLSDNMLRVLFATKLIGRAQNWLHSRRNSAGEHFDELLNQFCLTFGTKESKLEMRKKFEERKWKYEENFVDYFNEKLMLSGKLSLAEDELVEYIIDGIPNMQIRTQMSMYHHTSSSEIIKALAGVKLQKPKTVSQTDKQKGEVSTKRAATTTNSRLSIRCYNCNSIGHYAADCGKPRRMPGTCYACGSDEHMVTDCTHNKKKSSTEADNHYVRMFNFSLMYNSNYNFSLECLIDSGSPASFIRRDVVPKDIEVSELENDSFYGLNRSKLKTYGKFLCYIEVLNKNIKIELVVVDSESMKYCVLLGRDFLRKTNSRIVWGESLEDKNVCEESCEAFEKQIMSINLCLDASVESLNVCASLPYTFKTKLEEILRKTYFQSERPDEPEVRSEMKLVLECDKTFNCPPRRLSYVEKQELQKILDDYLEKGIIRVSESEFASPIVLVRKKTGDLRMCIDFRNLNKVTAKHNYPIPLIDDLLERLGNKRHFTKLDLKNGFFHVFMSEESIKYTSFITPLGQFEFLRMPFGLKNAPSIFQMFINKVFADLVKQGKVIIYLDDIMIATERIEEHLEILEEVMKRIVNNKLELRLDKCEFLQSCIKYLGYTIDAFGIRADDKGLEAVNNFPLPDKVRSVQSFLGLASYFRRFIKDFSIIAKPLYDLTRKDRKFVFGPVELAAFETLKGKLLESPVLALYEPSAETELHCDASALGFGAILVQKNVDGRWHPVFYFSKRSTEAESKFHSYELETLAIVYALRRFRVYLHGKRFKVVTDCNSLTMTLNKRELNPRIARWALEMQNFDYVVEHRSGKRMQHVDALSRSMDIMMVDTNTFEENLVICQNKDPKIRCLKEQLQKSEHKFYEMRNDVLYKKLDSGSLLFYVPEAMESHVMYKYHNEMGHVGINKVVELIGKSYWFPHIASKVKNHIGNCLNCIAFSAKSGKIEGYLHNIPKSVKPFEMLHIDHYGPIDRSTAKKHLLVVIDACTKFVRLYPTKTTATKEVIKILEEYFRYYSRPKYIVSDRGRSFTSNDFAQFAVDNNIQHIKIATGSPQANGQVERVNRNLGPMIAKLTDSDDNKSWEKVVESVEFTLNNTRHRMIDEHPSVMLFGINQKGKIMDNIRDNVMAESVRNVKEIRGKAHEKQIRAQAYNENYVNSRRKDPIKYTVGDYVVVKNFDCSVGANRKLIPKYKGPYKITKVLENDRYILEDVDGFQQTQIPYKGIWSTQNIKYWFQGNNAVESTFDNISSNTNKPCDTNNRYSLRSKVKK